MNAKFLPVSARDPDRVPPTNNVAIGLRFLGDHPKNVENVLIPLGAIYLPFGLLFL
jgi:hypothetical protein